MELDVVRPRHVELRACGADRGEEEHGDGGLPEPSHERLYRAPPGSLSTTFGAEVEDRQAANAAADGSSASASTSSTEVTRWKRIWLRTSAGTSSRSARFRSGRTTSVRPAACAARTFCLTPPIGRTRPWSVTSPVMPIVCL